MKLFLSAAAITASAGLLIAASSTPVSVEGTVKGKVVFDGKRPEPKPLTISDEQSKDCCETGIAMDTTDRSLLIHDEGGVANVVVAIEIDGKEAEMPAAPLVLDQQKCRFEPHVVVLPVGATVSYKNSDKVSHNIHTYATKNDGLNKTVSAGSELEQKLEKAEAVEVKCDIHPWMNSWVVVTDASVWAVTQEDGSFEIGGLAPGTYKLELWHEKLGKAKADVTVAEDGSSEMVEVKLGEKKKGKGRRRR